jgi:hypothetical protein
LCRADFLAGAKLDIGDLETLLFSMTYEDLRQQVLRRDGCFGGHGTFSTDIGLSTTLCLPFAFRRLDECYRDFATVASFLTPDLKAWNARPWNNVAD